MENCNEWFKQGEKLGKLFVYWKESQERIEWFFVTQETLNETKKELDSLRNKVRAKHFSKSQLDLVAKEIDDLDLKIRNLHRL
jgi:hypothetical protein